MYNYGDQANTKVHNEGSANESEKQKPINWVSVKKGKCMYKFDTMKSILEAYEVANLFHRYWSYDIQNIDDILIESITKELAKHPAVLNGENLYGDMSLSYSDPIIAAKLALLSTILPQYISKLEAYVEEGKQFGYSPQEEKLSILTKIANNLDEPDIKADKILSNISQLYAFITDNKSFEYWDEFFNSIRPLCITMIRNLSMISLNISSCIEGGITLEQEVFIDEDLLQE